MSMFGSIAIQGELTDLLKWIEAHKEINDDTVSYYIDYEALVEEIESRIKCAEYD